MKVLAGFVLAFLLIAAGAALVVGTGLSNVAASVPPDLMDKVAPAAKVRSIRRHAAPLSAPLPQDAASLARGLSHYRENCLPCHGATGVPPAEFHEGMNPEPPEINSTQVQSYSDAELFWVIKHGIRMTGMPGFGVNHKDDELRDITAFVRHAPRISPEEKQALQEASHEEHHHEGEAAEGHDEATEEHHHEPAAAPRAQPPRPPS
jgi:mono/diheme cytochrome c family protein